MDYGDSSYCVNMAICYKAGGLNTKAMECYQAALGHDTTNSDARLQLALLCQELGIPNRSPLEPSNVVSTRTKVWQQAKKIMAVGQPDDISTSSRSSFAMIAPRPPPRIINHAAAERALREKAKDKDAITLFIRMQTLVEQARNGDVDSRSEWMTAAKVLIESFQSERVFFPYEKYMRFFGYSREARKQSFNSKLDIGRINRGLMAADGQTSWPG
jgi:general transcription factor 3C polypeptide 3 (transcription factor C subunit 4)